jgi:predicted nucleic acid-binding protein
MGTFVVDASVIVKWLLADPENEADTERATALMSAILAGEHRLLQPVHWLAEVAAVLARISPATALEDVQMLRAMDWPVADDPLIWGRAVQLSLATHQHLFDTLYHSVALESPETTLVTADRRYRQQAQGFGRLVDLREWS